MFIDIIEKFIPFNFQNFQLNDPFQKVKFFKFIIIF